MLIMTSLLYQLFVWWSEAKLQIANEELLKFCGSTFLIHNVNAILFQ